MKIRLLRAYNGDAIHLRTEDEEEGRFINILIDGGKGNTYSFKNSKKKDEDGDLKVLIENIRSRDEHIDLLVLTHIDDDHIGGILKWIEKDGDAKDLIKKVWFNSGRLISEHFDEKETEENLLNIKIQESNNTSVRQGVTFEDFIEDNNIWDRRIIKSKDEIDLFGLKFTILSPSDEKLQLLLKNWEKEVPIFDTSKENDYSRSLPELIDSDLFKEDASVPNGSCIAFLIEKQGKKILFLGDAHPQVIINSLIDLGYSEQNPLEVNYVKLSHHGSKSNTNIELLKLIRSEKYLISSNGDSHQLPDKRCLARIIKTKEKVNFYFNYPELISKIFTEQDYESFPNFTTEEAPEEIELISKVINEQDSDNEILTDNSAAKAPEEI